MVTNAWTKRHSSTMVSDKVSVLNWKPHVHDASVCTLRSFKEESDAIKYIRISVMDESEEDILDSSIQTRIEVVRVIVVYLT